MRGWLTGHTHGWLGIFNGTSEGATTEPREGPAGPAASACQAALVSPRVTVSAATRVARLPARRLAPRSWLRVMATPSDGGLTGGQVMQAGWGWWRFERSAVDAGGPRPPADAISGTASPGRRLPSAPFRG